MSRLPVFAIPVAVGAAALALTVVLAGCAAGGSNSATTADATASSTAGPSGQVSGQSVGGRGDAASGLIAAISGKTLQVQNSTEGTQTAVTYSSSTTFTEQVSKSLSDVKVGDCVVATGSATSATASADSSAAAATVVISTSTNGTCAAGFGGGGFGGTGRPSGAPTRFASGTPSVLPSGGFRGGFGGITTGKVTAVNGSTITVDAVDFQQGASSATTAPKTVTVDSSTKYTTEAKAAASSLKVGLCATARGQADDSGNVAATTISLTKPASDGTCSTGFGGRGFGGAGQGSTGTQNG